VTCGFSFLAGTGQDAGMDISTANLAPAITVLGT
jgi:hypothetical protein